MDPSTLLKKIAFARPNHSEALGATARALKEMFFYMNIPTGTESFMVRPYVALIAGLLLFIFAFATTVFLVKKRFWPALLCGLFPLLFGGLEFGLGVPAFSWMGERQAENITVKFIKEEPKRELIFAAHYDSKTDVLDHTERLFVYAPLPFIFLLGIFLALRLGPLKRFSGPRWERGAFAGVILYLVYFEVFAFSLGGFILLGRQSRGVVDDGAAVVALVKLAEQLQKQKIRHDSSNITILLTAGEEVGYQGAIRHLKTLGKNPAPVLINLELVGREGDLLFLEKEGSFFNKRPADPVLIGRLDQAWFKVAGRHLRSFPFAFTDAGPFMQQGIPAVTLARTGAPGRGYRDLHAASDNMDLYRPAQLRELIRTLKVFIEGYEVKQ